MLAQTSGCDIHDNQVDGGEFGIRVHLGSSNNKVYDNVFKNIWNGECLTQGAMRRIRTHERVF